MAGNYDPTNLPDDYYDYPAKDVSGVVGGLTSDGTGATLVIMSKHPADVDIYVNDVLLITKSLTASASDAVEPDGNGDSHSGYFTSQAITGLIPFTVNTWRVVQGAYSDSGAFRSNTNKKATKFSVMLPTCFAPIKLEASGISAWTFGKHYIKTNTEFPLLSILHSDDIHYAQGFQNFDQAMVNTDGKLVGLSNNSSGLKTEYDFNLAYMSWFGLLTPFYSTGLVDDPVIDLQPVYDSGLNPDFRYCMANTTFMPQWGDHEFANNIGWLDGPLLSAVPNGYHKTLGGYDGNGLVAYQNVMQPLQGDAAGTLDTNANHWSMKFCGSLNYLSFDPITNAVYNADPALSVAYGANQILDILNIADASVSWFTCVANPAIANRGTPTYQASVSDYLYKNENYSSNEYNRIWRDQGQTPPCLMENVYTNGVMGGCVRVRADWHYPVNLFMQEVEDVGNSLAAESFMEIGLGTVDSSSGISQNLQGNTDLFLTDGAKLLPSNTGIDVEGVFTGKPDNFVMTVLEVDGVKATPEMVIKQWNIAYNTQTGVEQRAWFTDQSGEEQTDADGNIWKVVMAKRMVRHAGNAGYDIDETDIFQYVSTAGPIGGDE